MNIYLGEAKYHSIENNKALFVNLVSQTFDQISQFASYLAYTSCPNFQLTKQYFQKPFGWQRNV